MNAHSRPCRQAVTALALGAICGGASAQQFTRNTNNIPGSSGYTENVDFADIDNDGDWDAVFAEGGDVAQAQERVWLNLGPATVGVFDNVTGQRFPVVLDQSRDIEFVDFDGDGDPDLYISNTSQITPQSNKWWRNTGPGAGIGFYVDETPARWIGLGGPGSSISPNLVLPSGGFIDWSCDCDFGDLDNDGDLDLVHSTYGGALIGRVPTRLFLNDGAGHFTEFNPSGFQLLASALADGSPGLWAQGAQSSNTVDSTGAACDVASSALDIDLADIDGDFDLDILHGARGELPRMFRNRLEENGTLVAFRDVTGAVFPPGYSTGGGHYDQAMGDHDGDGDTDIYGVNWLATGVDLFDVVLRNDGAGTFGNLAMMSSSQSDDNEADYFDYDLDGDLDVIVANFFGQERMYKNDGAGNYAPVGLVLPPDTTQSLDADTTDVDNDGDPDVFVANDAGQSEWYLRNITAVDDGFAPRIDKVEHADNRTAGASPTVVRTIVRDNTSYYVTWYDPTVLLVIPGSGAVVTLPMHTSQGDVFRGEIPGTLVGTVRYSVQSQDQYGNTGTSIERQYCSGLLGASFCFGDGSLATACPCAAPDTVPNPSGAKNGGCANSFNGNGALLCASGAPSPDTVQFEAFVGTNYIGFGFLVKGDQASPAGTANADGVRCVSGTLVRFGGHAAGTGGAPIGYWTYPTTAQTTSVSIASGQAPGQSAHYQLFYRNAAAGWCSPGTANWSNLIQFAW